MDWTNIIIAFLGLFAGGGIWHWIKAREDKRKTPYDMFRDLLVEQKKFYEERNADYEREKLDSAEKSSVIMQSHFCQHKYTDPNIVCPVDVANDARLKKRCDRCGYNQGTEPAPEPEQRPSRPRHHGEENDDFMEN